MSSQRGSATYGYWTSWRGRSGQPQYERLRIRPRPTERSVEGEGFRNYDQAADQVIRCRTRFLNPSGSGWNENPFTDSFDGCEVTLREYKLQTFGSDYSRFKNWTQRSPLAEVSLRGVPSGASRLTTRLQWLA